MWKLILDDNIVLDFYDSESAVLIAGNKYWLKHYNGKTKDLNLIARRHDGKEIIFPCMQF